MNSAQDKLVFAATVISESAWLFAALGMLGLLLANNGSPLGLIAVLVIVTFSFLIARFMQMVIMPTVLAYAIQMLSGVIVIYFIVATQIGSGTQGIDLGWLSTVVSGTAVDGYTFRAGLGSILGAGLWWRGGMIAASEFPVDGLGTSFRIGVLVIAAAALVDVLGPADLSIFPVMFLFFAAGLGGLSIGHVLPASQRAIEEKAWPRVIGGVVLGIVVIGLLFSLLQRNVLVFISTPVLFVLNGLATVVFFVIILPIAFVVGALTSLVLLIVGWLVGEQAQREAPQIFEGVQELEEQSGEISGIAANILQTLEMTLVAILILAVLYLMAKSFRRRVRWRLVQVEGMRESVKEDSDAALDLGRLLLNLLPKRFRSKEKSPALMLPDDDPGVVEVFRVYFGLLTLAEGRGFPKGPAETPREYQHTLEQLFPRNLARAATSAFIRACYGHHPASREQIEEMKASLAQLQ